MSVLPRSNYRQKADLYSKMIAHSRPTHHPDEEASAIMSVLRSGYTAGGSVCRRLEQRVSNMFAGAVVRATPSGEIGLWMALASVGVRPGDHVVVPAYTCDEVSNAAVLAGAIPVFADVDERYNINHQTVERVFSDQVGAIVVTHQYGFSADVRSLTRFGVPVVEDLAHAIGGHCQGETLGMAGQAGILSFHATKMLSCGEGGMVFARGVAAGRLRKLTGKRQRGLPHLPFPDILAAVAEVQWSHLEEYIQARRTIAQRYRTAFERLDWSMPNSLPGDVYYRFPLRVVGLDFDKMQNWFEAHGVMIRRGVDHLPMETAPTCPMAGRLFGETISLPIYPSLSEQEFTMIVAAVSKIHDSWR